MSGSCQKRPSFAAVRGYICELHIWIKLLLSHEVLKLTVSNLVLMSEATRDILR